MLRSVLAIVSLLLPIAPAFGQTAPAANPNAAATYRVVYLEVAPADVNRVAAALKEYRQRCDERPRRAPHRRASADRPLQPFRRLRELARQRGARGAQDRGGNTEAG